MAWTELTHKRYERSGGRYASDVSDAEWRLIAPLLPAPRRVGRSRTADLRDVFDAIPYIATTGCQWRMLPNDFPPVSTVRRYFYDWRSNGLLHEIPPSRCRSTSGRRTRGRPVGGGDRQSSERETYGKWRGQGCSAP